MKTLQFFGALAALVSISAALHAQDNLIAGWDFSPYRAGYSAVGNDYTGVDTLWANFSGIDTLGTTNGFCGPNDYHFGTFYYNGQYGSSQMIDTASPFAVFWAATGDLTSNDEAAANPYYEGGTFNSTAKRSLLTSEGQATVNAYSVQFVAELSGQSFVFAANLGEDAAEIGNGWTFSYAGKMLAGGSTTISWSYSTDGSSYTDMGITHTLTTVDTRYELTADDLGELDGASEVYIRGTLGTISTQLGYIPLLDNVAIRATVEAAPTGDLFGGEPYGDLGWYYSEWFKWYWPLPGVDNAYFSPKMGWIYAKADEDSDGVWIWAHDTGLKWTWFYTEPDLYPLVYNTRTQRWERVR
ncbi:MAG: hypothetical protein E1N59_1545 [Puniceicoccaceae bacterium 5H]|nr:MAG: hypothetical protein E1N59_1545 [Puniceicoccaceae bacterium 5H]